MKKIFSFTFAVAILLASPFNSYASCDTGGVGASSCSVTLHTEAATVSITTTLSVTCRDGYYACCNAGVFGSAHCKKNPQPKRAYISPAN